MYRVDATGREDHTQVARVRWTVATAIASSRPVTRYIAALAAVATVWLGIVTDVHIATSATLVALIPAALVDVLDRRLPDRLVARAAVACFASTAASALVGQRIDIVGMALGVAALSGPLLALHLASPVSMGFGDVKAGAVIGMALGLTNPLLALIALCVGSAASAAVAIVGRRRSVAFGPGLVGGAIAALMFFVSPAYGPSTADTPSLTSALATEGRGT